MNKLNPFHSPLVLMLLFLSLFISACGTSQKTDFYQLEERSALSLMDIEKGAVIGVGPINLPEYINRPQIVTRLSKHHLKVSEFNRWIEPVNDSVRRLLVINLSNNLNSNRVYGIPGYDRAQSLDLRIGIDVGRFDGQLGKDVLLEARWSLYDKNDKAVLTKVSLINMPTNGQDYSALVLAMNNALQALGEEVSKVVAEYIAK